MTTRRLPVRVVPVPGEAIDSWLEATAERMALPLRAVARAVGLPIATRPTWIRWLARDELNVILAATGVESSVVEALTLSVYDGIALQLDRNSHRLDMSFPFGALSRSRFCPECLRESDGRWQLAWRLGWSFACVVHNCLLADACPSCGRYQRQQQVYRHVPAPTLCTCGESLATVQPVELPADHPITHAQRQVFDVINNGATSFGVFEARSNSVRDVLDATRSMANRVLNFASTHGLAAVTSADGPWAIADLPNFDPVQARNALNDRAPSRAIDTAVGVTAALHILRSPTIKDAADRTRPFIEGQNADTGPAELRSCSRDSAVPSAIAIKARSRDMGPELQLRYRTAITMPCAPDLGAHRVQTIAAALPAAMWQEWSKPLLPDLRETAVVRATLSCATLLVGSQVKTVGAARLLGDPVTANALNQRLWLLCGSAYWQSIGAALIRLSDYLNTFGAPIDYQRRRNLDYSGLLSEKVWNQMCIQADEPPVAVRPAIGARYYLIERLSGTPAQWLQAGNDSDARMVTALVINLRRGMRTRLEDLLDDHAQSFLAERGVHEPVVWHPPLALLDDLDLPHPNSASA